MSEIKTKLLEPPEIFDFPFPPYDIQQQFMKTLYSSLEDEKLGIFESPTGTVRQIQLETVSCILKLKL